MNQTAAIILAAGKGTRMNSPDSQNKVASDLAGHPMIWYTLQNLNQAGIRNIYVVVGYAKSSVHQALGDSAIYIEQPEQLGTGHAVNIALPHIPSTSNPILSLYGDDSAFYPPELITKLIVEHKQHQAAISLLTINVTDPTGLGRIIRQHDQVIDIVEEKNATPKERQIKEINTGLYCFDAHFLRTHVDQIQRNPLSQEFYLTDLIPIAYKTQQPIYALKWPDNQVWFGVNTPPQLTEARKRMQVKSSTSPASTLQEPPLS